MINGMRVIESLDLVQDGERREVWRPCGRSGWKVKRIEVPRVPYQGAVRLNATTLVMHPVTLRQLRESLRSADAVDPQGGTPPA